MATASAGTFGSLSEGAVVGVGLDVGVAGSVVGEGSTTSLVLSMGEAVDVVVASSGAVARACSTAQATAASSTRVSVIERNRRTRQECQPSGVGGTRTLLG